MSEKITFTALNNTFTVHAEPILMTASHDYICRGRIGWESLTINGVEYPSGEAWVLYRDDSDFRLDLSLYAGISGRGAFSDSARKKLTEALMSAPETQHVFVKATIDEVNAYMLERAHDKGHYEGDAYRKINDLIQEIHSAAEVVTGQRTRSPYTLPRAEGLVTEADIKRAFLEGMIERAQQELAHLDK